MSTTNEDNKDVSGTGGESLPYPVLVEKMREQNYSPSEVGSLLDDGWTQKRIEDELLPPFGEDGPPEKVDVEYGYGMSAETQEPEKPGSMSDEEWERVPDMLKPASPVELEKSLLGGGQSWHFAAGDLRSRRVLSVVREAMGCDDLDALDEHHLWAMPLVDDVVMLVYPTPEGVGLSFAASTDYAGEVFSDMSEVVPLDWMGVENRGRQSQWIPDLAERLANRTGNGNVDTVKRVLARRAESIPSLLDSYGDDAVEFFSHPETGDLVADTLSVKGVYSLKEDQVEYRIKMRAPDALGIPGATGTLTLDGQAWAMKSADAVKGAYMSMFGAELDLSDEMATMLFVEWDAMREMSTSADIARETLVDGFLAAVNGLSVTDAPALESWDADAPSGILFEDDGEDYIAVGARWATSVLRDESRELSHPMAEVLLEEGVVSDAGRASGAIYDVLKNAEVDQPQSSVYVIPIGKTAQDAAEIRAVEEELDDLTVEL